ncbi:MAG: lysylphosphatidylglycerol synthase domain-containing protein [Thiohalorhabdus sp.]|uniref:lysylphosphatidylglycerol synthase domain-containing protein n=1 Tax=Thiohalorhabdus sp. TaxID=3094134 RepID=UPI0039811E55
MGAPDSGIGAVRAFLRPHVFLPVLLAAALVFFLLSISDLPTVLARIERIAPEAVVAGFGLTVAYLALKGAVLRTLLAGLGYPMGWRPFLLAFAVGELAVTVPSGVYAQNYVLSRLGVAPPGRSSAATTLMILVETLVVMAVLSVLGIPGWDWLGPLMVGLILIHVVGVAVVVESRSVRRWLGSVRGILRPLAGGALGMIHGVRHLGRSGRLWVAVGLTTAYLVLQGMGLLVVGRATGLEGLAPEQAVAIFFVALWVTLLVASVLTQLGVIEAVALGAAQAYGYGLDEALAAILGYRVVWLGSVWLVCGGLVLRLHRELASSG